MLWCKIAFFTINGQNIGDQTENSNQFNSFFDSVGENI